MDGQQFDDLARVLARGTSRRQVLQGLVGGLAGGTLVALGVGRRAASAAEGSCLVGAGDGHCAQDSDCCKPALCNTTTGYCYCDAADNPGIACSCTTGTENMCGLDTLECCAAGSPPGSPGVCVRAGSCSPPRQCGDVGDACTADGDCCEGEVCGSGQTCVGKTTCAGDGQPCSQDGDCCAGHCGGDQTCVTKSDPACVGAGAACAGDGDCCEGTCSAGGICFCQDPARPALGCACTTGTDATCGDATLICCPSGDAPGGPGVCTSGSAGCTSTDGGSGGNAAGGADRGTTTPSKTSAVVVLPKTGSGARTAAGPAWATPLALLGAGTALVGAWLRRSGTRIED